MGDQKFIVSMRWIEAQLRATANGDSEPCLVRNPFQCAHLREFRNADYIALRKDHPLRFGIDLGGEWD